MAEPTRVSDGKNGSNRQKAFNAILRHSFRKGDYTLSSGAHSPYYLDMKSTLFQPEAVEPLAEMVIDRIRLLNPKPTLIGGMELGAVPLISPIVMRAIEGRSWKLPGFFVRKEAKKHGTMRLVEGVEPSELKGAPVVILDDVTTSGKSVLWAVDAVRKEGATVALVLSIVDRESGATELFKSLGIEFDALFRASAFMNA